MSDELNRFIAEKVLKTSLDKIYVWGPGKWSPYDNFSDCEAILQQVEKDGWSWSVIKRLDKQYNFDMFKEVGPGGTYTSKKADTLTAALVRCVAKCYGWKEEG